VKLVEILNERGYTKFSSFTRINSTKRHNLKGKKDEEEEDIDEENESK
jgi:hypothetical protein